MTQKATARKVKIVIPRNFDTEEKEWWLANIDTSITFSGPGFLECKYDESMAGAFTDTGILYEQAKLRLRLDEITEEVQKTIAILDQALQYKPKEKGTK
jgi:hypothetical protein